MTISTFWDTTQATLYNLLITRSVYVDKNSQVTR